jgi:hypothetical protein
VSSDSREYLRSTFEEVAELYDLARTGHPARLFDELAGPLGFLLAGSVAFALVLLRNRAAPDVVAMPDVAHG